MAEPQRRTQMEESAGPARFATAKQETAVARENC